MSLVRKYFKEVVLGALFLANLLVWTAVYGQSPDNLLRVYFFDIGQGDSVFIDSPYHGRILLDGGRNRAVLGELGKVLPFGDKRIDVMIESHPDADHIGGLPEVVSRYDVGFFLEPGVESDNKIDDELHKRIEEKNIPNVLARKGMVIDFGDGAKLEILFPNQDVSKWETNDASIVAKLTYGEKSFLFTGDSTIKAENILLNIDPRILDSDVLKAGHHGSHTSTSLSFAQAVSPEYTVISAGKDNSYGHPHKETLDTLVKVGSKIVATEDVNELIGLGTILFETDGKTLQIR
jgi:competence protein ComEC